MPRSLSIVFGTPISRKIALLRQMMKYLEAAIAADADQRIAIER